MGPLGTKLQWNFNQNTKFFIQENAFENIVCQNGGHFVQVEGDELSTVKPVCNDHLYNKLDNLWYIQ